MVLVLELSSRHKVNNLVVQLHLYNWHARQGPHLDVLDAKPLHDAWREHSAGEGTPEDGVKLLVQATNAQALKVECLGLEQLCGGKALLAHNLDVVVVCAHKSTRHTAVSVDITAIGTH